MTIERWKWIAIVSLVVGLGTSTAYAVLQDKNSDGLHRTIIELQERVKQLESTLPVTNIFDPLKNKPGDKIAGLTVVSIEPFSPDQPLVAENVHAKFSGNATVSGSYRYYQEIDGQESFCLTVSASNREHVPILLGRGEENKNFCLRNFDEIIKRFRLKYGAGLATIVVRNYEIWYRPGVTDYNEADFDGVLSIAPDTK